MIEVPEIAQIHQRPRPGSNGAAVSGHGGWVRQASSRLAWSAADEWRRLAEVRSELERQRMGSGRYDFEDRNEGEVPRGKSSNSTAMSNPKISKTFKS